MKFIIILLLAQNPFHVPFDSTLSCGEQGEEIIEAIATYHGPGTNQGNFTPDGKLLIGWICN